MQSLRYVPIGVKDVHFAGGVGVKTLFIRKNRNRTVAGSVEEIERGHRLAIQHIVPVITRAGLFKIVPGIGGTGEDQWIRCVGIQGIINHWHILRFIRPTGHQRRHDQAMVAEVKIQGRAELVQICEASGGASALNHTLVNRKAKARQQGNDRDHHQQLNQSESAFQCGDWRLCCICSISGARSSFTSALASE